MDVKGPIRGKPQPQMIQKAGRQEIEIHPFPSHARMDPVHV
jgi:hypothetical protein